MSRDAIDLASGSIVKDIKNIKLNLDLTAAGYPLFSMARFIADKVAT